MDQTNSLIERRKVPFASLCGTGPDRLHMMLPGQRCIWGVIQFPQLKPNSEMQTLMRNP